jgi:hypothetical protein
MHPNSPVYWLQIAAGSILFAFCLLLFILLGALFT